MRFGCNQLNKFVHVLFHPSQKLLIHWVGAYSKALAMSAVPKTFHGRSNLGHELDLLYPAQGISS